MDYFIHESAYVDKPSSIGRGTKIWHFSHILANTNIGEEVTIGQNVVIGPRVSIGDRCKIQNNVSVYEGVELEEGVFCGPSMVFTNVINPRALIEKKSEYKRTLVKKGATLGANCTIICGITIGEFSLIGAGSVITKDIKPYALVVGVPGNQIGWVDQNGEKIPFSNPRNGISRCFSNGKEYELKDDFVCLVD